jgi:hypothetical protein
LKLGLIENIRINRCIDFAERSNFSEFVLPLYARRQETKDRLKTLVKGTREYNDTKKDDIFYKLILNNAYGKYAQNPRKFKECFITDTDEQPGLDCDGCLKGIVKQDGWHTPKKGVAFRCMSWGPLPHFKCDDYWIWQRPQDKLRFNNVATAASITGAARAVLMEAIATADDPIYCDTDSVIARNLGHLPLHDSELGAWKIEHGLDEIIIAGKKLYACKVAGVPDGHKDRIKVKSKGVSGLSWRDLERALNDEMIEILSNSLTLDRYGGARYMRRNVRATAKQGKTNRLVTRAKGLRA